MESLALLLLRAGGEYNLPLSYLRSGSPPVLATFTCVACKWSPKGGTFIRRRNHSRLQLACTQSHCEHGAANFRGS